MSGWSRFDTPGRTLYAAEDRASAFLEALSFARKEQHDRKLPLAKLGNDLGMTVKELWAEVEEEWTLNGHMSPWWVPATWRDGRRLYELRFADGSWIDIANRDTLHAISVALEHNLSAAGIELGLTLSHITSDDRALTTRIAAWLRNDVTLDDGSQPVGVRFISKHGPAAGSSGVCWAFWMRQKDIGLVEDAVTSDRGTGFKTDDPDYARALELHNISGR